MPKTKPKPMLRKREGEWKGGKLVCIFTFNFNSRSDVKLVLKGVSLWNACIFNLMGLSLQSVQ